LIPKNPAKATEVVMRLSQLMNYMLYSANYRKVAIAKEVRYLEDYIELEKIRYDNDLQIVFHHQIGNGNFPVAPLLLQPFVENAFKHGLSRQLKDAWLKIDLVVNENEMSFKVTNSKPPTLTGTPVKPGIGIDNVKKRLALLYPESHRLKIMDEQQTFLVSLTITNKEEKNTA
jgi:LytS/YehU family sensor histidine kinase